MIVGTLTVFYTLTQLKPVPVAPPEKLAAWAKDPSTFPGLHPGGRRGGQPQLRHLPVLPGRVPVRLRGDRHRQRLDVPDDPADLEELTRSRRGADGTPERYAAEKKSTKEASAVIGIAGAVGALGGFLIPITFSSPWVDDPVAAVKNAFIVFAVFYVVCLAVTWVFYLRPEVAHDEGRGVSG